MTSTILISIITVVGCFIILSLVLLLVSTINNVLNKPCELEEEIESFNIFEDLNKSIYKKR